MHRPIIVNGSIYSVYFISDCAVDKKAATYKFYFLKQMDSLYWNVVAIIRIIGKEDCLAAEVTEARRGDDKEEDGV